MQHAFVASGGVFGEAVGAAVDGGVEAVHVGVGDGRDVDGQLERAVTGAEFLLQVVLHTEAHVDDVGREEGHLADVGVLLIVSHEWRLEFAVDGVEPAAEGAVAEVGVEAEEVVAELVVAERVVGGGVDAEVDLEEVLELDAVAGVVVLEEVFGEDVQVAVALFVPVGRDVVLREAEGAFERRGPVAAVGDELRGRVVVVGRALDVVDGHLHVAVHAHSQRALYGQVVGAVAEVVRVVMAHVSVGVVLDDDAVFGPFKGVDGAVEGALPRSIVEIHGAVEDDAPRIVEVLLFEEYGHEERVDDDGVVEGEVARYAARGAPPVARPVERTVGHGERFRGEDDGRAEVGGCGAFQGRVTSGTALHPLQ